MESDLGHEIIDTIGVGDFATVYRARDGGLGREVAIKQIHQQYLIDPARLEPYWRQVQLLAWLEHPNILTVYDVAASRGCLVLELMRHSLKPRAEGRPVDPEFLRVVLASSLNVLEFLHRNGITHGDVKPSNILLDRQDQVKLADFGPARRATSDDGNPLEGTTKYLAPELVSEQFGPAGTAGDLYSLGFSAYELMCGSRFESLLPGLAELGPDKQAAWTAWHAAAEWRLPEIDKVLEDVPEDISRVIQRLTFKDQSERYQSAAEALDELRPPPAAIDRLPEQEDSEVLPPPAAKAWSKRRIYVGASCALACLAVLLVFMLLPTRQEETIHDAFEPVRGVIRNLSLDQWKLSLEVTKNGSSKEFSFEPGDKFFVNEEEQLFRNLQAGDQVVITARREKSGRAITVVSVSRPEANEGQIESIKPGEGEFTFEVWEGDDRGKEFVITVPRNLVILLNGEEKIGGWPVELKDLRNGDRVFVRHKDDGTGRTATELKAKRTVTLEGTIRDLNTTRQELTIAGSKGGDPKLVVLPFAPNCKVTINDKWFLDQEWFLEQHMCGPVDLRPGDKVTVLHDTEIIRVDARRAPGQRGVVKKVVVKKAEARTGALDVLSEGGNVPTTFTINPKCVVSLGGELVELEEIRTDDIVEITSDAPDNSDSDNSDSDNSDSDNSDSDNSGRVALTVSATRPLQPTRWAILIGIQDYDDLSLSPLEYPVANARLLQQMLINRYGVPRKQAGLLENASLNQLQESIGQLLGKVGPDGEVIVYFAGHAYQDDEAAVYLAAKDFVLKQITTSGLPLLWLVDQFEQCEAAAKLLLLDCCNEGKGVDLAMQPSTARMLRSLKTSSGSQVVQTVWAGASCGRGQRGHVWPARGYGVFACCLAEGFSGKADADKNTQVEATELFAFLKQTMASSGAQLEHVQEPVLFRPARLRTRIPDKLQGTRSPTKESDRQTRTAADPTDKEINDEGK